MKQLLFTIAACIITQAAMAQKKHSFAIAGDFVEYAYPSEWWGKANLQKTNGVNTTWMDEIGLWAAYYYKNRYSIRVYTNYLGQAATYLGADETLPNDLLTHRQAVFHDLTVGYNLLWKSPLKKQLSTWVYVGLGISGRGDAIRMRYYPYIDDVQVSDEETDIFQAKAYPTAQVMIKYNPIPYVFIGAGATYHYLYWDFQPVSGNLSIGFQL